MGAKPAYAKASAGKESAAKPIIVNQLIRRITVQKATKKVRLESLQPGVEIPAFAGMTRWLIPANHSESINQTNHSPKGGEK